MILQYDPLDLFDEQAEQLANRINGVPNNQIMVMLVNQAYDIMGLPNTKILATTFDGMARHSPEGFGSANTLKKLDSNTRLKSGTLCQAIPSSNNTSNELLAKRVLCSL